MMNLGTMFGYGAEKNLPPIKKFDFLNNFNKENFDLNETIQALKDKSPINYDEQVKYYEIFEIVDKKMREKYGTDIDTYKEKWGQYEDELYARCCDAAEDINKGITYN